MKLKKTVLKTMLCLCLLIPFTTYTQSGLTTDSVKTYTFTDAQIRKMFIASLELDACNKTVVDLSNLIDTAQFHINTLDYVIHEKSKKIITLKKWRSIGLSFGIVGVLFGLLN